MKWYASRKLVSLIVVLFLGAVFSGYFLSKTLFLDKPTTSTYVAEDGTVYERTNILLLGIDARKGETQSRTDTIILVSVDPESQSVALLSIPRDTLANLPGHGEEKINAANVLGGVELTKKAVENLLGVPINYHVMTNFEGFKDIIDTLGGVTLDIEEDMVYTKEGIKLEQGLQKLNGDKALQYVRFRSDAMGDIGRTERQQRFLKAIAKEALQLKTLVKLPKLLPQIEKLVQTDMSVAEMAQFADIAKKLKIEKLVTQTLPGNFYDYQGISYWKVDEKNVKAFVQALLTNGKTADVIDAKVVNQPGTPKAKKNPTSVEQNGSNDSINNKAKNTDTTDTTGPDNTETVDNTVKENNDPEDNTSTDSTDNVDGTDDTNTIEDTNITDNSNTIEDTNNTGNVDAIKTE